MPLRRATKHSWRQASGWETSFDTPLCPRIHLREGESSTRGAETFFNNSISKMDASIVCWYFQNMLLDTLIWTKRGENSSTEIYGCMIIEGSNIKRGKDLRMIWAWWSLARIWIYWNWTLWVFETKKDNCKNIEKVDKGLDLVRCLGLLFPERLRDTTNAIKQCAAKRTYAGIISYKVPMYSIDNQKERHSGVNYTSFGYLLELILGVRSCGVKYYLPP